MTGFAHIAGRRMGAGFAGGQAVVVAGDALGSADLPMIDEPVQRQPGLLAVAAVALIGGGRMTAGFGRTHATAHVATHALVGGFAVGKWHNHRQPGRGGMTGIAVVAGLRMVAGFTQRLTGPVVTAAGGAIGQDGLTVVKRRRYRQPRRVAMTRLTGVAGGRMGTGFAGGAAGAIMTTRVAAAAGKLTVIDHHLQPIAGAGMAVITRQAGDNMAGPLARRYGTVVAGRARIAGLAVVDGGEQVVPGAGETVAGIALIGGQRMVAGFAVGNSVVVAAKARGRADLPVVDEAVQR